VASQKKCEAERDYIGADSFLRILLDNYKQIFKLKVSAIQVFSSLLQVQNTFYLARINQKLIPNSHAK
jgi:hypothetical protein